MGFTQKECDQIIKTWNDKSLGDNYARMYLICVPYFKNERQFLKAISDHDLFEYFHQAADNLDNLSDNDKIVQVIALLTKLKI